MCYEDKVIIVADAIERSGRVTFKDVEQAKEWKDSWKLPQTAPLPRKIRSVTKAIIADANRLGVAHLLDKEVFACRTLISTTEEAIRLCAARYLDLYEIQETKDMDTLDREGLPVPV